MSVYTSESPETLTDTVQRACVVYEESYPSPLCIHAMYMSHLGIPVL